MVVGSSFGCVFSVSFVLNAKSINQTTLELCAVGIIGEMSGRGSRHLWHKIVE